MVQKYLRIILAVVIVVAAPVAYWYAKNTGSLDLGRESAINQLLSSEYAVTEVGSNSFGELNSVAVATGKGAGGDAASQAALSSGAAVAANIARPESGGGAGGSADSKIVPPFAPEFYEFNYTGADLGEMSVEQPVYKRVKENTSTGIIDRIIQTLSLGLIDLSKFESTKLQNFTINEDREYGYSIYVDVEQGMLNLYQNYLRWPQPLTECRDEDCYRAQMPKLKDIPEDSVIIEIANRFVAEKQVSLTGYGSPRVTNDWRRLYEASEDQANFYFPEVIDVVYPLMIDGQEVFDEGGTPSGLHISVDYRKNRVVGLYDLTTKQYEKSVYKGETDNKRILEIAEKGGFRNYYDPGVRGAKRIVLNLDTPTVQVLRMWRYDTNTSEEIFVPSLVFPIKNPGTYWRRNVVVPLVKEVLDKEQQPPVTIMERGQGVGGAEILPAPAPEAKDLPITLPGILE